MGDDAVSCGSPRAKWNNIKFKCAGGHTSFDITTTKAKKWCYQSDSDIATSNEMEMHKASFEVSNFDARYEWLNDKTIKI